MVPIVRVLAVDPGSANIGIAVFDNEELIFCERLNPESNFEKFVDKLNDLLEKVHREFRRLIIDYDIERVCWEITPAIGGMSHKDYVVSIGAALKVLAFRYGLPYQGIGATTAKKTIVGNYKATKIEVREAALALYPDMLERFGLTQGSV